MGLLVVAGCRKKSAPEYYALESDYSILVAREGDDAYASEDMDTILARLRAIDPDALEGPKAAELAAKIEAERQRVARETKEKEAADALAAVRRQAEFRPGVVTSAIQSEPQGPEGALPAQVVDVDAGRRKPYGGMPRAEFEKLYGDCFDSGPAMTLPNQPEGSSMVLRDDAACRSEFGVADPATKTYFVFVKDALVGQRSETRTVKEVIKEPASAAPAPPASAGPPDAGQYLLIPGAPLPPQLGGPPLPPPEE
jgi:hypothetical protein